MSELPSRLHFSGQQFLLIFSLSTLLCCPLCAAFSVAPKKRLTVCCAGDSIIRPIPYHLRRSLNLLAKRVDIRSWARGGLSSETYRSYLEKHKREWKKIRCDFLLLQLGTNDVEPLLENRQTLERFRENMVSLIHEFKGWNGGKSSPVILLGTVLPFCAEEKREARNRLAEEKINPILREIALREGIFVVDNFSIFNGHCDLYEEDRVHPNSQGERLMAKNWLYWIKNELRKR